MLYWPPWWGIAATIEHPVDLSYGDTFDRCVYDLLDRKSARCADRRHLGVVRDPVSIIDRDTVRICKNSDVGL